MMRGYTTDYVNLIAGELRDLQRKIEIAVKSSAVGADVFNNEIINDPTRGDVRLVAHIGTEAVQKCSDALSRRPAVRREQTFVLAPIDPVTHQFADQPVHADAERSVYRRDVHATPRGILRDLRPKKKRSNHY